MSREHDLSSITSLWPGYPLTTVWTPPASCFAPTHIEEDRFTSRYFIGVNGRYQIEKECYPPGNFSEPALSTGSIWTTTDVRASLSTITYGSTTTHTAVVTTSIYTVNDGWRFTPMLPLKTALYYSPGICPSGYSYAAKFTDMSVAQETEYLCCPSSYKPLHSSSYLDNFETVTHDGKIWIKSSTPVYFYPFCTSTASQAPSNTIPLVTATATAEPTITTTRRLSTNNRSTNRETQFTITASGIVVAWQATDTAVVNFIQANNIQLPQLGEFNYFRDEPRLSTAAKAGIVVGTVFMGILFVVICLWRAMKSMRRNKPTRLYSTTSSTAHIELSRTNLTRPSSRTVNGPQAADDPPPAYTARTDQAQSQRRRSF